MESLYAREQERQAVQTTLDSQKSQGERNQLGQFATPFELACQIVRQSVAMMPEGAAIRFLDPAVGSGVFFSALRQTVGPERISAATRLMFVTIIWQARRRSGCVTWRCGARVCR